MKKKMTYIAVLEPNNTNGYGIYFPDLPGCISVGKNFEDAKKCAKECLELHIYGMEKDGEELPAPSESISKDSIEEGSYLYPVTIYPDLIRIEMDQKRVKTNTTIPFYLKQLAEINHINMSRVLEAALIEILDIKK